MVRLRLLGGATIERDDGTLLTGPALQRHRVAILALLAAASGGGLSRDKLIGLLWPDSDTDRARNLLNVALYQLRKALGETAIVSSGDDLRLDRTQVVVDVHELEVAAAAAEHAGVVGRYRGLFLDGFFLSGAPDFEQWLDAERSRLAAVAARSLEALATDAAERGEYVVSVDWWRQRAALDPLDARIALQLMQALEASGNRSAALQHARVHAKLLETEVGLAPDQRIEAYATALTRMPGPSNLAVADAAPAPTVAHVVVPDGVATATRWPRRIALFTVAALAVVIMVLARPGTSADRASGTPRSIAVLPFVNLGADPTDAYLGDGLTEELTARLSTDSTLRVVSRTSSSRFQQTTQTVPEIAKALNVSTILEGSVRRVGNRLRVTAQLIDARDDRHLWAATYDREIGDVLSLQDQLARDVTRELEPVIGRPTVPGRLRGTRDAEAYDLYLRGRWHWRKRSPEGHALAITSFRNAIARDSGYADAYAGLSDAVFTAYVLGHEPWASNETTTVATMRMASERAVTLDPQSSSAHTSLAIVHWAESDLSAAERSLQQAIALNPGNAVAHGWYGQLLSITGHPVKAARESYTAWERDPLDLISSHSHAAALAAMDSVQASSRLYLRTLELDSTFYLSRVGYAILLVNTGDTLQGAQRLLAALRDGKPSTQARVNRAWALALLGRADSATRVLTGVIAGLTPADAARHGFVIARAYTALRQPDSAFVWLERADWRWPPWGNVHARELSSLWSDPRYALLSQRVGRALHADATRQGWVEVRPRAGLPTGR